eukprot:966944-Prorocentrum_minimum.AAC.1
MTSPKLTSPRPRLTRATCVNCGNGHLRPEQGEDEPCSVEPEWWRVDLYPKGQLLLGRRAGSTPDVRATHALVVGGITLRARARILKLKRSAGMSPPDFPTRQCIRRG